MANHSTSLKFLYEISRVHFLTSTYWPFLIASFYSKGTGDKLSAIKLLALGFALALIHFFMEVRDGLLDNRIGSYRNRKGVLRDNATHFSGGALVSSRFDTNLATKYLFALLSASIPVGLFILMESNISILALSAAGLVCVFQYAARPLKLSHNCLGEICLLICFGPVVTLGSFLYLTNSSIGEVPVEFWLMTLPLGLVQFSMSLIQNCVDLKEDLGQRKKNIPILLGVSTSLIFSFASSLVAFGIVSYLIVGIQMAACLSVLLLLTIQFYAKIWLARLQLPESPPACFSSFFLYKLHGYFGCLMIWAIVVRFPKSFAANDSFLSILICFLLATVAAGLKFYTTPIRGLLYHD